MEKLPKARNKMDVPKTEENKLTDEEVLTAIEICFKANLECCKCPYFNKNGRNFCIEDKAFYKDMKRIVQEHSEQKEEIEQLSKDYESVVEMNTLFQADHKLMSDKLIALEVETNNQQAEIERLTEESNEMFDRHSIENQAASLLIDKRNKENSKLQKQVDELTAFKTEAISMSLYGKGRKDGEEVAVKDTAKKIYSGLLKEFSIRKSCGNADVVVREMALRYGVEVE